MPGSIASKLGKLRTIAGGFLGHPIRSLRHQLRFPETIRASDFADRWDVGPVDRGRSGPAPGADGVAPDNPLRAYFDAHEQGRGLWKWLHYFDVYHRHLGKFIGKDVHLVEIGILSGGSLEMWRAYLGPGCHVTGIDIHEGCRALEGPGTSIRIGDQADRSFWKAFREQSPPVDILIDDGGHDPEQQIVTLEETLPYLRPGGVYLCEDVHGLSNPFSNYVHALADRLNLYAMDPDPALGRTREIRSIPAGIQKHVLSFHFYPYIIAIEKSPAPVDEFFCRRRGTEWGGSSTYRPS
jgi:Methyltransferase domain